MERVHRYTGALSLLDQMAIVGCFVMMIMCGYCAVLNPYDAPSSNPPVFIASIGAIVVWIGIAVYVLVNAPFKDVGAQKAD